MKFLISYILISFFLLPSAQNTFSFNFLKKIFSKRTGTKERKGFYYQTKKGDSFWSLSRRFNVSEKRLKRANKVRNNILPLAKIYIPRSTYKEAPKQTFEQHPHPKHDVKKYVPPPTKTKYKSPKSNQKPKKYKQPSSPKALPKINSPQKKQYLWPIKNPTLAKNGKFGEQNNGTNNNGILLNVDKKQTIHASRAGLVIYSGKFKGYGNMVILDHLDNYFTLYIKLGSIKAKKQNIMIKSQEVIGYTTNHPEDNVFIFEIKKLNQSIDPLKFLDLKILK